MADFVTNCGFVPTAGGTTDWTYSSAVTGYQSPANAQAVNGATYVFRAQSADNTQWEYAVGAYNSGTGVFARTTVLYNSSGTGTKQGGAGTKINFSSAPVLVAITAIAEEITPSQAATPCVRLTLTSGTAVTASDVTGATSVYVTPYNGNIITLYDGAIWVPVKFTEVTLSLSGFTANTNYDVWGRVSSGALAVDTTAWTNDTTRATAIALQDGIDVKSGDTTRRLLGTIRITGTTGQTEDSKTKRFVSNRYNTDVANMQALEPAANWTYSTATWRQANANASNQLAIVSCTPRLAAATSVILCTCSAVSGTGNAGIGINSTSVDSATTKTQASTPVAGIGTWSAFAEYAGYLSAGLTTLVWLEQCSFANSGTMTFYGNPGTNIQTGITAVVAR